MLLYHREVRRTVTNLKSFCIWLKLHRGATQYNVHDKSRKHPHDRFALHGVWRYESWKRLRLLIQMVFMGVWLHFRRAKSLDLRLVQLCTNIGKKVLY